MSVELKDIIERLLDKNPNTRLGSQNDADEIVNHPWFKTGIDFDKLMKKEIKAPFVPDMEKLKGKKKEAEESKEREKLIPLDKEEEGEEITQSGVKLIEKH